MDATQDRALRTFQPWKIYLAIFLGLGATFGLFFYNVSQGNCTWPELFGSITHPSIFWLVAAILVLIIRDAGYVYRIRHITGGELSWKGSVYSILLWEFSSAITPSVVGGTAVAIFILNREGISSGKSVAFVALTAMLDNLFFILAAPLALLLAPSDFLSIPRDFFGFDNIPLGNIFWVSYGLIALYSLFMAFGVLISPKVFQSFIVFFVRLFRLRSKWRNRAYRMTFDVIIAAREIRGKSFPYWLRAIGSTLFIWVARYFMLNCLFAAFVTVSASGHGEILAKQVVLWITQLVSPTPGGAGFAEYFLEQFFAGSKYIFDETNDANKCFLNVLALIWRGMTYYAYLAFGAIALPRWLRRVRKTT